MKSYQEVTLMPQMDVNYNHVSSLVYQELHNALSECPSERKGAIAVSFPEYYFDAKTNKSNLGKNMRVFAEYEDDLDALDLKSVVSHFSDYVHITNIKDVGDKATHYEVYTRYRHDGYEKRARRFQAHFIKKFGDDAYAEAFGSFNKVLEHCKKYNKQLGMPYINVKSNSNGNEYCIRIKKEQVDKCSNSAVFNLFGLSCNQKKSTVPGW